MSVCETCKGRANEVGKEYKTNSDTVLASHLNYLPPQAFSNIIIPTSGPSGASASVVGTMANIVAKIPNNIIFPH